MNKITDAEKDDYIRQLSALINTWQGARTEDQWRTQDQYTAMLDTIRDRTDENTVKDLATAAIIRSIADAMNEEQSA